MNFNGQHLRDARKAAGLTIAELYRDSGVSIEIISRAERGKNVPNAEALAVLAGTLGVTMESLYDRDEVVA